MSRVYRALEKAEKEKQTRSTEGPSLKILKEEVLPRAEEAPPEEPEKKRGKPEEKRRRPESPPPRDVPTLIVPPGSFAEEQFRKLKVHIFHRSSPPPRLLLVTSTTPNEGKTTVALNLALTIAKEIHKKAVLVDADLRNPSIHFRNHPNSKGLSQYLSEHIPLSDVLVPSGEDNLWLVPSGPPSRKSSEFIGTRKMKEFLDALLELGEETFVVVDSPPLLAASDPILLSKMVDGVILVVMADQTPRESVRRAVGMIDREKIMGIVLNRVAVQPSKYYYGYYGR